MNLVEAFKQIGRDIKALVTKTDKNEKVLEGLQPTVDALANNLDQILGEVVSREEFDELKKEIAELKGKQNHE
nr:MAG TPA: Membrane fusogenic activity protein [Caudoviricetes sp.]